MKNVAGLQQVVPEPMALSFSGKELQEASVKGFRAADIEEEVVNADQEITKFELLGDVEKVSEEQKASLMQLKEPRKYSKMKLKLVNLSFSGASVFFFTPYRSDGTPMPASVMKFDLKDCIEEEMEKTETYRKLFGSTTPSVKDSILLDSPNPVSIMQIDLCGGAFGLPEFAKAPPVQTFASILEQELDSPTHAVEIIPILNEALERRLYHFTMSQRKIKVLSLAESYKLVRFVGHGILNRAKEGAKRGAKSPALAAGFQQPVEIDELDPDGKFVMELCGRKQTVRDLFQNFTDMEKTVVESLQRKVVVGLAHNDLHGGNLLVDSQGLVWLIDFATVKQDQHVLIDLTKFLSACTFMYLQEKVKEQHIQSLAKMMAVTPDATTDMPLAFLNDAQDDPLAVFFFRIISRLRYCMCIYESGPGSPENDGLPFAVALFSWSTRMLSYSEPSLYQKTRALYWSIAGLQRILWAIGHDVGPVATQWIEEKRSLWEGQKGRRLSSSVATDKQAVEAYQFELELPTYLSQAGASEGWATDILTREKVNVAESSVPLTMSFDGRLETRRFHHTPEGQILFNALTPMLKTFAPALFELDVFCGRTLVVGDAGSGKSVLTKQIFAALAQDQVKRVQALAQLPKVKDDEGRVIPPKLDTAFLPVRVPLVDWSRHLEKEPDKLDVLEADILSDLLWCWLGQKYGEDSNLMMLVTDMRNASLAGEDSEAAMGLVLLLDGLDEASSRRMMLLEYIGSLLANEPNHLPVLTSRPGVLASKENDFMASKGFVSVSLSRLSTNDALTLSRRMMERMKDSEDTIQKIEQLVSNPAYFTLTGNPLCLCLLTNVLRKTKLDGESTKILDKVEVYQRAFKLMLHQSDASKFASRDGASDQIMIKAFEALKTNEARKFFQAVAWQGQSIRARALTMQAYSEISESKDLFECFSMMLKQDRLPIFQKLDVEGESQYQLAHLSFQEMLCAEFAAGVLRFANSKSQVREYMNFVLSNSAKEMQRDRLADNWWVQVWVSVGNMLEPTDYNAWCALLASDERTWLVPGRKTTLDVAEDPFRPMLMKLQKPQADLTAEEINMKKDQFLCDVLHVDYENELVQLRLRLDSWSEKFLMKLANSVGAKPWSEEFLSNMEPSSAVSPRVDAVNVMMVECTKLGQAKMVKDLVSRGVHHSVLTNNQQMVMNTALQQKDFDVAGWLADRQVDLDPLFAATVKQQILMRYRYSCDQAPDVQRPFVSCAQLSKLKRKVTGILQEAFTGSLKVTEELDVNYVDPRTGVSLLMLAAAGSHPEVVAALLQKRALVNAKSAMSCTALSFAVDCTNEDDASLDCMRLLLEAKANVNVQTQYDIRAPCLNLHIGGETPLAFGPCFFKHERKLDLLCQYGCDLKQKNRLGINAMLAAMFFVRENDERAPRIWHRLQEAGLSPLEQILPAKDYYQPGKLFLRRTFHVKNRQLEGLDQRFHQACIYCEKLGVRMLLESGCKASDLCGQFENLPKNSIQLLWLVVAVGQDPNFLLRGDMECFMEFWKGGVNLGIVMSKMLGVKLTGLVALVLIFLLNPSTWQQVLTLQAERDAVPLPGGGQVCSYAYKIGKQFGRKKFCEAYEDWMEMRKDKYQRQLKEKKANHVSS